VTKVTIILEDDHEKRIATFDAGDGDVFFTVGPMNARQWDLQLVGPPSSFTLVMKPEEAK
jgi:hypothetical protein